MSASGQKPLGPPDKVAMVLSGGGARGAYEIAAASVLLEALMEQGRPKLFVGTSAGALNAISLAASGHLNGPAATVDALNAWRYLAPGQIFKLMGPIARLCPRQSPANPSPSARSGILDTTPLREMLKLWPHWKQFHQNIESGAVQAVAVVASSCETERPTVFWEGRSWDPLPTDSRIDYVETTLAADHVAASAAIPFVFPPVYVTDRPEFKGWYVDGGLQLNTPILPALDLGADGVAIVATAPPNGATRSVKRSFSSPRFQDILVQTLDAILVDPMARDIETLKRKNQVAHGHEPACDIKSDDLYRKIQYIFASPGDPGELPKIAEMALGRRFLKRRFSGLDFFGIFLTPSARGELLSYLYFVSEFLNASMECGKADAERLFSISRSGGPLWST